MAENDRLAYLTEKEWDEEKKKREEKEKKEKKAWAKKEKWIKLIVGLILAAIILCAVFFWGNSAIIVILSISWAIISKELSDTVAPGIGRRGIMISVFLSAFIFTVFSLTGFLSYKIGWQWILFLTANAYLTDTLAWLFGGVIAPFFGLRLHKMAPKTSPNKSWEAGIFGIIFTNLILRIFMCFCAMPPTFVRSLGILTVLIIVASIAAIIGDLSESKLKRMAGIKDASNLLPGHGGITDKADSFTAVAIVYLIAWLLFNAMIIS